MKDSLHTQQRYMEEQWTPPERVPRNRLTPWADLMWHASLMACREMLPADLSGQSMLLVNCGSGDDTHYFETEGAGRIVVSDLSHKAATHTRNRCQVAGAIVCDTCHLPFADGSFDLVGVRSGLHHLDDPWAGLAEMARVAQSGVFFIEGQETPLTGLFVRLGMLEREEEVGNKVYRFTCNEVRERLAHLGFGRVAIRTDFHFQIPALIALSERVPGRLPAHVARACIRTFNALFHRWGNCLTVSAFFNQGQSQMPPR